MALVVAHRRQPGGAAAPQQADQQGLGLIVARVAGHCVGWEGSSARGAGTRLDVRPRCDVGPVEHERGAEVLGGGSSVLGLVSRRGTKTVVDVVSGDVEPVPQRARDERGRVGSAGEGARDGAARRWETAVGEEGVEPAQRSCSRPRLPPG